MAKKPEDGNPQSANTAKNVIRGVVLVVLIGLLVAAVLDFRSKGQWDSTFKAVGSKLDAAGDGLGVDEIEPLIEGSPSVNGDLTKDPTVTYTWGVIRSYKMELSIEGQGAARVITRVDMPAQ